jgi:hypothetical protein
MIRGDATVVCGAVGKPVHTWDLGRDGMCLLAPRPIAPGTRCRITFDVPMPGELINVTAAAKIVYSSYSAPGEFKIGALFLDLPADVALVLARFAAAD